VLKEEENKEKINGNLAIGREYRGRQSSKENDHGKLSNRKNTSTSALENLTEKKERQDGTTLKSQAKLT
jgi:hypothetical protein